MSAIKFKPREIGNMVVLPGSQSSINKIADAETLAVAAKLSRHLAMIDEYNDRLDATNFLIDNAAKLTGNPKFKVNDTEVAQAVGRLGGQDTVDFDFFKDCIDIMISEWKKIVVYSITDITDQDIYEKAESGEK